VINSDGTSLNRATSRIFRDTSNPIEHFTGHTPQSLQTWRGNPKETTSSCAQSRFEIDRSRGSG